MLDLEGGEVDRRLIEAGRRSGLQPGEGEAGGFEALGERNGRRVPEPACGGAGLAEMNDSAQERAGGHDNRAAAEGAPVGEFDPGDSARVGKDAGGLPLDHCEVGGFGDERLHRAPIEASVGLGARALDCGTLAAIEDAELDAGLVSGASHQPVERVDLANEMSLAEPADRRIAGHFADGGEPLGHERGLGPAPGGGGGRFRSGVSPADHDDVEPSGRLFHVKHIPGRNHFPTHRREKISPSTSSTPIRPATRSRAAAAWRKSSAISSGSDASGARTELKDFRAS